MCLKQLLSGEEQSACRILTPVTHSIWTIIKLSSHPHSHTDTHARTQTTHFSKRAFIYACSQEVCGELCVS